jgi:hypothetical protein
VRLNLDGTRPSAGVEACHGGLVTVVLLPAVLAACRRPGLAGQPPCPPDSTAPARAGLQPTACLEVRLDRRLADRRPAAAEVGQQAQAGLVEEDQSRFASMGVSLLLGQSRATKRAMVCSSRSAARRTGRWTLQPSRWRSTNHTYPECSRIPVSRWITSAMRASVHKVTGEPVDAGAFRSALSMRVRSDRTAGALAR